MKDGTVMITSSEYRKLVESKTRAECKIQALIKENEELTAKYEKQLFEEWSKGRNSANGELKYLRQEIEKLQQELKEAKEPCTDCASRKVEEDAEKL